jgi:hypothetical protein
MSVLQLERFGFLGCNQLHRDLNCIVWRKPIQLAAIVAVQPVHRTVNLNHWDFYRLFELGTGRYDVAFGCKFRRQRPTSVIKVLHPTAISEPALDDGVPIDRDERVTLDIERPEELVQLFPFRRLVPLCVEISLIQHIHHPREQCPSHRPKIRWRVVTTQMMSRICRKVDVREQILKVRPVGGFGSPVVIESVVHKPT